MPEGIQSGKKILKTTSSSLWGLNEQRGRVHETKFFASLSTTSDFWVTELVYRPVVADATAYFIKESDKCCLYGEGICWESSLREAG